LNTGYKFSDDLLLSIKFKKREERLVQYQYANNNRIGNGAIIRPAFTLISYNQHCLDQQYTNTSKSTTWAVTFLTPNRQGKTGK